MMTLIIMKRIIIYCDHEKLKRKYTPRNKGLVMSSSASASAPAEQHRQRKKRSSRNNENHHHPSSTSSSTIVSAATVGAAVSGGTMGILQQKQQQAMHEYVQSRLERSNEPTPSSIMSSSNDDVLPSNAFYPTETSSSTILQNKNDIFAEFALLQNESTFHFIKFKWYRPTKERKYQQQKCRGY
jgi:hypothetical protein